MNERSVALYRSLHEGIMSWRIDFASGIPCGVQRLVIRNILDEPGIMHVPCNRESEALGLATGACLAGRRPLVYMQNSGLFGGSNDLASLVMLYRLPILLTVTWRGIPGENAPQHQVTGRSTLPLIEALGLPYRVLTAQNAGSVVGELGSDMLARELPGIILIKRGWDR